MIKDKKFLVEAVKFRSSTICITVESLRIDDKYKVFTDSGRNETNLDTLEWVKEAEDIGAGEIILTSINNEGTGKGYDLNLYEKVSKNLSIPLLAHGGPKNPEHIYDLFRTTDIDGAVIASAFHLTILEIFH